MAKYCLGLPLARSRQLTADEMSEVRRWIQERQIMALLAGTGLFLSFLTWVLLLIRFLPTPHFEDEVVLWVSWPLVAGALSWFGWRTYRRAAALSRDLARGQLLIFEGHADLAPKNPLEFAVMMRSSEEAEEQSVEMLEYSEWVYRVNGMLKMQGKRAKIVDRGEDDPVPGAADTHDRAGTPRLRGLTAAERSELERTAAKGMPFVLGGLALTVASIAAFFFTFLTSARVPPWLIALGGLTALWDLALVIFLPGIMRLRRDSLEGNVQIMDAPGGQSGHAVGIEVLPLSGRVWTIEGYPAEWRRARETAEPR